MRSARTRARPVFVPQGKECGSVFGQAANLEEL